MARKAVCHAEKSYRDGTLPRDCIRQLEGIGVNWMDGKRTGSSNSIEKIISHEPIAINSREYCFEDGM